MKRTIRDAVRQHQQQKQQEVPPPQQPPKAAKRKPFRLPDKSNFSLTYSATTESWSGALTIGKWSKTSTAPGVHRLLIKLGQSYMGTQEEEDGSRERQ
jgi:hypothetical protein